MLKLCTIYLLLVGLQCIYVANLQYFYKVVEPVIAINNLTFKIVRPVGAIFSSIKPIHHSVFLTESRMADNLQLAGRLLH